MLCPDCKNQYDTCITCAGTGQVNPSPNGSNAMDQNRIKYKLRREGSEVYVDLWFDDCQLQSRLIVGGDEKIALMVESGELRLTKDSKLAFEDGTLYEHRGLYRHRHPISGSKTVG